MKKTILMFLLPSAARSKSGLFSFFLFSVILLILLSGIDRADSHGRLIEPPSRSTMWRYGFNTPPNYNDHELYCGGFSRMWRTNEGKCGICGDPWDIPLPRPNEAGGMYGRGIIVRKYAKGQVIKVRIELTANHNGFFQFRLCPNNDSKKPASQACLDQNVLKNAVTQDDKYYPGPGTKVFEMHYQLPPQLTCLQCVFQWRYVAGNNWGVCQNGTGAVGCGPQEEFRACADVTITEADGTADASPNGLTDAPAATTAAPKNSNGDKESEFEHTLLTDEVRVETSIIIAFCSMLATAAFFALLFFYYTRGKGYIKRFVEDKDWDMPSMPSMPSMPNMPKMPKMGAINWPLTNVQIKKLPSFLHKSSSPTKSAVSAVQPKKAVVSAPIHMLSSTNEAATGPPTAPKVQPRPPPRARNYNKPPPARHPRQPAERPIQPSPGHRDAPCALCGEAVGPSAGGSARARDQRADVRHHQRRLRHQQLYRQQQRFSDVVLHRAGEAGHGGRGHAGLDGAEAERCLVAASGGAAAAV